MGIVAKMGFLCLMVVSFTCFVAAQEKQQAPTSPVIVDGEPIVDGFYVDFIAVHVTVWDSKGKIYLKNLASDDFEILSDNKIVPVEFLKKASDAGEVKSLKNEYVLGFLPDVKREKWHSLKIRVRAAEGTQKLVVRAQNRYFY